jgi:hypothetical protein
MSPEWNGAVARRLAMTSLVEKVRPTVPLEPGERILCAAYVRAIGSTRHAADGSIRTERSRGPSVVVVSNRRFLFAPRSAFMSTGAWEQRRLDHAAARVKMGSRRTLGFPVGSWFEVSEPGRTPKIFELERKDAAAFRAAFGRTASSRP